MLDWLIQSRPPRSRNRMVTAGSLSLLLHAGGILGAIYVTAHASRPRAVPQLDTTLVFLSSPQRGAREQDEPKPETRVLTVGVPLKGFQTVVAVSEIPTDLPPVDLHARFDPRDYSGIGVEGGSGIGVEAPHGTEVVYLERVVEERPERLAGPLPAYPPLMKLAGIEGTVMLEFVVDTLGRVEPASPRVISSPSPAFHEPAIAALRQTVFRPGRVNGRAVRVLVRMPFNFVITQSGATG